MSLCKNCGSQLSGDETSLYMKIIDMKANEFLCINCLGEYLDCDTEILRAKIEHFKKMGCVLF